MCGYVDNCMYEIGGLGKVTTDGEDFFVSDVEIFKQKVTEAHVDMTAEALADFQYEKAQKHESLLEYKFWWHSHAKMGVFFSGTDTNTIDSSTEFPWLVSVVTNHLHELTGRVDIYSPVHMYIDKVPVVIVDDTDEAIVAQCLKDIEEKVTMPILSTFQRDTKRIGYTPISKSLDDDDDNMCLTCGKFKTGQCKCTCPVNTVTTTDEKIEELNRQLDDLALEWEDVQKMPEGKKKNKLERRVTDEGNSIAAAIDELQEKLA